MVDSSEYEKAISRVAQYLRSPENLRAAERGESLTAFVASEVLGIAFQKSPDSIMVDVLRQSLGKKSS